MFDVILGALARDRPYRFGRINLLPAHPGNLVAALPRE
jgi:hypothetical protein